jgi:hypothetical protein
MHILFEKIKKLEEKTEKQEQEIKQLRAESNVVTNITNIQNNHFNTTFNFNLINFGEGAHLMKEILANDGIKLLEQKFKADVPRIQQISDRVVDLVGLVYRNPNYKEMQGIYVIDPSKEKENAYYHEAGEWKLSDWNPLRQQLLQNLSYQMAHTKGIKLSDVENMIKLIYAVGGGGSKKIAAGDKKSIGVKIGKLLAFGTITE